MPKLNELSDVERERAKKAVRDLIWKVRRRFNLETGLQTIRPKPNKKSEAEFHPQYVAFLEENFVVQDMIISLSRIPKEQIQELIKQAGLLHANAGN